MSSDLHFVSEVRPEKRYLEISSSCLVYLRKKEILFFARPSVFSYLSLLRWITETRL